MAERAVDSREAPSFDTSASSQGGIFDHSVTDSIRAEFGDKWPEDTTSPFQQTLPLHDIEAN